MANYRPAPAVEAIARRLIADHHRHLSGVAIEYCFRDEAAKSKGKLVHGKASKVSGLNAYLATTHGAYKRAIAQRGESEARLIALNTDDSPVDFFVVEIAKDIWDDLSERARQRLVDHELSHIALDDDGIPTLVSHDVEEFAAIVARWGIDEEPEQQQFAQIVARQLDLFDEPDRTFVGSVGVA